MHIGVGPVCHVGAPLRWVRMPFGFPHLHPPPLVAASPPASFPSVFPLTNPAGSPVMLEPVMLELETRSGILTLAHDPCGRQPAEGNSTTSWGNDVSPGFRSVFQLQTRENLAPASPGQQTACFACPQRGMNFQRRLSLKGPGGCGLGLAGPFRDQPAARHCSECSLPHRLHPPSRGFGEQQPQRFLGRLWDVSDG